MSRSFFALSLTLLPTVQAVDAAQAERGQADASRNSNNQHRSPSAVARLQGCTDPNLQGFAFFNERPSGATERIAGAALPSIKASAAGPASCRAMARRRYASVGSG